MARIIQNVYIFVLYHTLVTLLLMIKSLAVGIYKLIVPYRYRCKSVRGQTILITGSGSGIGRLMAKKFAKLGGRMVLVDVDERGNQTTANEIIMAGGTAITFVCDLSKKENIYQLADEVDSQDEILFCFVLFCFYYF